MIRLHHLSNSRSHRILQLMEELGLKYEIQQHWRDPKTLFAKESLRKVHPLGGAPVIKDAGLTIAESGPIIEYILDTYGEGRLRPKTGTKEYLRYRYFLHYTEGSLMLLNVLLLVFKRLGSPPFPWLLRPIGRLIGKGGVQALLPRAKRHLDFLEGELQGRNWIAGEEFTGADIQLGYAVLGLENRVENLEKDYPNLKAYIDRLQTRPSYIKANEIGGALDFGTFK